MRIFYLLVAALFLLSGCDQKSTNPIAHLINQDDLLKKISNDPTYGVQIIYTQIDRDELNRPTFTTYTFQLDSQRYFYPASTVKFPAALLAMEMINHLNVPGFTKYSRVEIDSAYSRQSAVRVDSTAPDLAPTVAHYIRKLLIVSDNDAYNRLYEFLGQDYINETLRSKKYLDTRILHRLAIFRTPEENLHNNPMRFYTDDQLVYASPLSRSSGRFYPEKKLELGIGYLDENDSLVNEPMDFTFKNFFPLHDQHRMMQAVFFPDHFPSYAFDLTEDDYRFLYYNMSVLPQEPGISAYADVTEKWPAYVKFFMFGSSQDAIIPDKIRIFNKIGLAYGFALDNAYIIDLDNGVEFLLTAVIDANENKIYNDGEYAYDAVALPFLAKLGQAVYQMELRRPKKYLPDFTYFKTLY